MKNGIGAGELAGILFIGIALTLWLTAQVGSRLEHSRWLRLSPSQAGLVVVKLVQHPEAPRLAFPRPSQALVPGPAYFYLLLAATLVAELLFAYGLIVLAGALGLMTSRPRTPSLGWRGRRLSGASLRRRDWRRSGIGLKRSRSATRGAQWAEKAELKPLLVARPCSGRLTLGRSGRLLLAGEVSQSVIVMGPTQSHKTTGFAVPAILEWTGPVLAASVKGDLLRSTIDWRRTGGETWLYDPTACTGLPSSGWSPLEDAGTWAGARRVASALCGTTRANQDGLADGDFWHATAAKLLAPLLFAAASTGREMSDVVAWVDTQEVGEVSTILEHLGVTEALQAAVATWRREERQRSSVYTTAETVLEAFADPSVAASSRSEINAETLLDGGPNTLYLCAPSHEQRRLQSVFSALVSEVMSAAYARVTRDGHPLRPPLLVVLDEAANIAPLGDLDSIAATAAGHGVQLVTVWQDMAQISARYGTRSATVVNNHRSKVVLSGISDPITLDHVSALVGEEELPVASTTTDIHGGRSTTESLASRRLAPADLLRRMRPGEGVLIYGHLPPARLTLRPWFADRELCRRACASPPAPSVEDRQPGMGASVDP